MMSFILGALKIATLVTVGAIFVLHLPQIIKFIKGECKTMDKKQVKNKIMKCIGGFVVVLGLAFEGGAFLAHVQGILTQVFPLAAAGVVCMIGGVLCWISGKKNR